MAQVRVRTRLNLKDLPNNIKKNFSRDLKKEIEDVIVDRIRSGKSPVKGKRFKDYSTQYSKRFKGGRARPVDMTGPPPDGGKMIRSLTVRQRRQGQVIIEFKSQTAVWHDQEGAGRSKVIRRLLPSNRGEEFDSTTSRIINAILRRAVRKGVRGSNR